MKGDHLGEFEELILLTVAALHGEAYGVAVMHAMKEHAGRSAKISAVHSALHRLGQKGLVKSWVGGATNERGGRRKRFFEITNSGKAALTARRTTRETLWALIPDALPDLSMGGSSR
jgi:DNA-binding PadR family transcriptional regulator